MLRRALLAVTIAAVGGISWMGTPHHAFATGVGATITKHGYDLWAETVGPNNHDCFDADASKCTGTIDNYVEVVGSTNKSGPATYVDFLCDGVTVKDGVLHEDWTEFYGPYNKPGDHATLTSISGGGQVVKAGPTSTTGSSGALGVSATGSWSAMSSTTHQVESFTGKGSAVGAFTTKPEFSKDGYGRISSGLVHISITGTIFHWTRSASSTSRNDWKAGPTTEGTMSCDVTPSLTYSDAYANPGNL